MKKTLLILISLVIFSTLFTLIGEIFKNNSMILIGICLILGFLVKFTDQLIDDKTIKKPCSLIFSFAILIPLLMIYLAKTNEPVFGMVIGTALALFIAGKLDHPAYIVSVMCFVLVMILLIASDFVDISIYSIYLIPLAFFGAFADEYGHEKISIEDLNILITLFFKHRFTLKIVAFLAVLLNLAKIVHLIGFLCFDFAYEIVSYSWRFKN